MGAHVNVDTSGFDVAAYAISVYGNRIYDDFKGFGDIISGYKWKGVSYDEMVYNYNRNVNGMNTIIELYAKTLPECLMKVQEIYTTTDGIICGGGVEESEALEIEDPSKVGNISASNTSTLSFGDTNKRDEIQAKFADILGLLNEIKSMFGLLEWESTSSEEFKSVINNAIDKQHYAEIEEYGVAYCNLLGAKIEAIEAAEITNKAYGNLGSIFEYFENLLGTMEAVSKTGTTTTTSDANNTPNVPLPTREAGESADDYAKKVYNLRDDLSSNKDWIDYVDKNFMPPADSIDGEAWELYLAILNQPWNDYSGGGAEFNNERLYNSVKRRRELAESRIDEIKDQGVSATTFNLEVPTRKEGESISDYANDIWNLRDQFGERQDWVDYVDRNLMPAEDSTDAEAWETYLEIMRCQYWNGCDWAGTVSAEGVSNRIEYAKIKIKEIKEGVGKPYSEIVQDALESPNYSSWTISM